MPTREYDVVIVGAGPAGSTCARLLAAAGASVCIIDAAKFPRPKTCAGWVNDRLFRDDPVLEAVRRKAGAAPFRRLVFHSPDGTLEAEYGSRSYLGHIVRRDTFDAALLAAAVKAGAKARLRNRVKSVDAAERRVAAILADGSAVAGRILVGADGVHSTVARTAGLRAAWSREQLVLTLSKSIPLTARQRTARFGPSPAIHVALGFGGLSGYAWAFPGRTHVNIGIGARLPQEGKLAEVYGQWAQTLVAKGLLASVAAAGSPQGGAIPAGAAVEFENHVGKRIVLVGDAGGFASAASGEGIYPAIQSASIAVKSILLALEADRKAKPTAHCQDELLNFRPQWRQQLAPYLQMPNVNITFLLPLIYTNREIADRFARAFLFGENL